MIHPSDIHTLTDFKRNSTEFIDRLESSGRPQVLTVDGQPKVVVLGVDAFERLAALAERVAAVEGVRRGLADVDAGHHRSLRQFEAEVHRKRRKRREG